MKKIILSALLSVSFVNAMNLQRNETQTNNDRSSKVAICVGAGVGGAIAGFLCNYLSPRNGKMNTAIAIGTTLLGGLLTDSFVNKNQSSAISSDSVVDNVTQTDDTLQAGVNNDRDARTALVPVAFREGDTQNGDASSIVASVPDMQHFVRSINGLSQDEIRGIAPTLSFLVENRHILANNPTFCRLLTEFANGRIVPQNGIDGEITFSSVTVRLSNTPQTSRGIRMRQRASLGRNAFDPQMLSRFAEPIPMLLGSSPYVAEKKVFPEDSYWDWAEEGIFAEDGSSVTNGTAQRTICDFENMKVVIEGSVHDNKFNGRGKVIINSKERRTRNPIKLVFSGILVDDLLKASNEDDLKISKNDGTFYDVKMYDRPILTINFVDSVILSKFDTIYADLKNEGKRSWMIYSDCYFMDINESFGYYIGNSVLDKKRWPICHGKGLVFFKGNGSVYEGEFCMGKKHGVGRTDFTEEQYYVKDNPFSKQKFDEYRSEHPDEFPVVQKAGSSDEHREESNLD